MASSLPVLVNQLKAAGDETRVRLLALLQSGERTVKELTEILGQSQPRISRHLKVLADAGLVARSPEGSWVYYRLADPESGGSIAAGIISGMPAEDPTLQRDRARLALVKQQNQQAADRFFAEHASDWDRIRSLHVPEQQVQSAILARAGEGGFRSLLDIGTGTGRMLEILAPFYERALGIDTSAAMLAVARANLDRSGIRHSRVRVGDAANLPVVRDSFDLVVIHQVLHFLDDPARVIAEAASAVSPGGRILIVDFAPHDLEFLREQQAHRRLGFSHEQVEQWLRASELRLTSVEDLQPERSSEGLTVTIWTARDDRLAAGGREAGDLRP